MLLKTFSCQLKLDFDHLPSLVQLLVWFVYIHESYLFSQQPSELLREHIQFKVKALRRQEYLGDCLGDKIRIVGITGSFIGRGLSTLPVQRTVGLLLSRILYVCVSFDNSTG